jgi:hypothetical protein
MASYLMPLQISGYDVLLTMDQRIQYQQNFVNRRIAPLILVAPSNQLEDLFRLVPAALAALNNIRPGSAVRLEGA